MREMYYIIIVDINGHILKIFSQLISQTQTTNTLSLHHQEI